jgi:hypothetical protein
MATHRAPLLLLAGVGLLFFAPLVLHPNQTLYSDTSDLLAFHLPYRHFAARSWQQTGELPLWCPYVFGGMPFAHDIGASLFYPFHLPLLWTPPEWLGAAVSWLVLLHVLAAGACMYAYARHRGLRGAGPVTAALGYMLAGKWLLHLLAGGHYNMIALAWLPIVLLFLEQAIRRRSLLRATWAGAAFALIILCAYPYLTLYAGLFVAVWTLGVAREVPVPGGKAYFTWAALGGWAALVAVALGAVQLLPGLESAAQASRASGVGLSWDYFAGGLRVLAGLAGPPLSDEPNCWENRAGLGVLFLALVVLGVVLGGVRVRVEAWALLGLVAFSLGGAAVVQWLPGFRLFRLPSRMLLVAALPAALLAGCAVQALSDPSGIPADLRLRCRRMVVKLTGAVLLLAGAFTLALGVRGGDVGLRLHPYWLTLLVTLPAAYGLLSLHSPARYPWLGATWVALVGVDLTLLSGPLVTVRPQSEIYTPSACVGYLAGRGPELGRVMDYQPEGCSTNCTPLWPGLLPVEGVESLRGFNPIDVRRYKEYLQFLTDEDRPLRTLDGMFTGPLVGTFAIENQALADLLGLRFLVQPAAVPLAATVPDEAVRASWTPVLEDPAPTAFNIIAAEPGGRDCGLRPLPPYVVYENRRVLPRAFVVGEAAPLPGRADLLAALKATDFRRRVLLEGPSEPELGSRASDAALRPAAVRLYRPNRVEIDTGCGPAGYLVLADVWFPGWVCEVDGQPAEVYRANYLFRAVKLPAGARRAVFRFAPASVWWGERISVTAAVGVLGLCGLAAVGRFARSPRQTRDRLVAHGASRS